MLNKAHPSWRVACFLLIYFFSLPLFASSLTSVYIFDNKITFKRDATDDVRIFTLQHPDRLVMDFKNTQLKTDLQKVVLPKNSHILKVRAGYPKKDILRIVFDLDRAVCFKKLNTSQVLILSSLPPTQCGERLGWGDPKPNPPSQPSPALRGGKELKANLQHKKLTIVIDPGHGGKDPGAIGDDGTKEKDVVLGIAQKLAFLINQNPNMRAVLTRNGDYYISLKQRLLFARKNKADLFIAVHADSYFNTRASGASVYSLSEHGASSIAARWIASRENHSELGGVDLGELTDQSYLLRSVLIDLAQTQTTKDSLQWGSSILRSLDDVTRLHYSKVERAPFLVLKSPDIPSVLVETGFLSNNKEEKRLRDPSHQHKIALALYNGIRGYRVVK